MTVLTNSHAGRREYETKETVTSRPMSRTASVAEASACLKRDHDEVTASLERVQRFAAADDAELLRGEWDQLEAIILRHMDAEEMFLLPAFLREESAEARVLLVEHAEIREQLGEIGLSIDLHTLRLPSLDHLCRTVVDHVAQEMRTLYPWAEREKNSALLDAVARRIARVSTDASPDGQTAATLLSLLRVCRDGERGYRRALQDVNDAASQAVLGRLANERARSVRTLREQLRRFGVNAQPRGSALGTIHRGWIDASYKAHVGPRAVLRECERGEELALRTYRVALRTDLPEPVRALVDEQYGELQRALEEVRALSASAS